MRKALARAVLLAFLTFGAMCGVPMDPEKIENLMNLMTQTKIVRVVKQDDQ